MSSSPLEDNNCTPKTYLEIQLTKHNRLSADIFMTGVAAMVTIVVLTTLAMAVVALATVNADRAVHLNAIMWMACIPLCAPTGIMGMIGLVHLYHGQQRKKLEEQVHDQRLLEQEEDHHPVDLDP